MVQMRKEWAFSGVKIGGVNTSVACSLVRHPIYRVLGSNAVLTP